MPPLLLLPLADRLQPGQLFFYEAMFLLQLLLPPPLGLLAPRLLLPRLLLGTQPRLFPLPRLVLGLDSRLLSTPLRLAFSLDPLFFGAQPSLSLGLQTLLLLAPLFQLALELLVVHH